MIAQGKAAAEPRRKIIGGQDDLLIGKPLFQQPLHLADAGIEHASFLQRQQHAQRVDGRDALPAELAKESGKQIRDHAAQERQAAQAHQNEHAKLRISLQQQREDEESEQRKQDEHERRLQHAEHEERAGC